MEISIRTIEPKDDPALALIIRNTLTEFGANKPGTVYYDKSTNHLSGIFTTPKSFYFVALLQNRVIGGAGIFPTEGLPPGTCELVKMYLLPEARGMGLGKKLIAKCIESAKEQGYTKMYLETMPELRAAIGMYENSGFTRLPSAIGNSGHHGCDIWMLKDLV
ncbi:MAG: GNAT family N-acetyltransferase [Bacteroidia bacterium]